MRKALTSPILSIGRTQKRMIVFALDGLLCVGTVLFAFYLRLGEWDIFSQQQLLPILASLVLALPLFTTFGLYRSIFRYAGWSALGGVVRGCAIYAVLYATLFSAVGVVGVPRTVGLIQPILLFLAVGGARAFARFCFGSEFHGFFRQDRRQRAFIYGAGAAGRQLAAALAGSEEIVVVGFIDDDTTLNGSVLNGLRIYPSDNLEALLGALAADSVFLAMPSVSRSRRNEIIAMVRNTHIEVRTLPGLMELAQGKITVSDLRELDIEDLLGRSAVAPNQILLGRNAVNKVVMVTGAGGSIGGELCRQIIALGPKRLIIVDSSEFSLYTIEQDLQKRVATQNSSNTEIVTILASVRDESRMKGVFSLYRPNTVYHAAAYKHVPMVEHNVCEGVGNNVFGTLTVAQLAIDFAVQNFVLISTDKAVRPTNVMGATKRLSEIILQSLAARTPATCFSMVRFGNVLGSSGSVVPLFRQQIREGGPLTITHEDITRYFMTIPEAAQLVIQAGSMSSGGEVFVLDMGAPVKIADLARQMVELSGLSVKNDANPNGDIEIHVIGLRPGEKLYEELLIGDNPAPTNHPQIMMARDAFLPWNELAQELSELRSFVRKNDAESVRRCLGRLVTEFTPEARIVDWLHVEQTSHHVGRITESFAPSTNAA
jgi:FlaA1/EpsC-like NDP-sugar epimerase